MNDAAFHKITNLQYRLKHAEDRIKDLESGEEYRKMKIRTSHIVRYHEHRRARDGREIARLKRQLKANRENWFRVFTDMQAENERRLREKDLIIEKLSEQLRKAREKNRTLMREVTETRAKVNDEKEKNQKLTAQVNQNFENSSLPSSSVPFRGKVPNNRVKTGRAPGAQPGHEGHRRTALEPTGEPVFIDAPEEIRNSPDYYVPSGPGSTVRKQVIGISFAVTVTEYYAHVYRNRRTGARYHAPFPEGVQLDVNYDDSVKALVFLLRSHLNVSIDKTAEFIREMTDGKVKLSHGTVSGINEEFSRKTEAEQKEIFARLAAAEVMYTDMTSVRHNGKLKNVVVCSDKANVYYAFRDTKGDAGLRGTPVEFFLNLLVHDHDKTFYHYGSEHQDCNVHHTRYLRGAAENEPGLTWHKEMLALLLEMNTAREKQNRKLEETQINEFIRRYDGIVETAAREYYDKPPSRYYRKGFNLYKELRDYKGSVLRFLENEDVDFGNNEAERCARKIKRHTVVSGSFRGKTNKSGEEYCRSMSVLQTDRRKGENIYRKAREYFRRPGKPVKSPGS